MLVEAEQLVLSSVPRTARSSHPRPDAAAVSQLLGVNLSRWAAAEHAPARCARLLRDQFQPETAAVLEPHVAPL